MSNEPYDGLKITKIRFYAIHFKYKGKEYMLHDSGECGEEYIKLYHKDRNKLHYCSKVAGCFKIRKFIRCGYSYREGNITYSHIDKEYFLKQIEKLGLIFKTSDIEREAIHEDKENI